MSNLTPNPHDLPSDPRLKSPSTYDAETIVNALSNFYERLPHIDPSDVRRAPAGGWPQITSESVAARGLRKTPEAVDLLRHLPYIEGRENCWIAPDAYPIDYRAVVTATSGNRPFVWELASSVNRFPPWVIQLTTGDGSSSANYMLDTTDGTVTEYVASGPVYPDPPGLYPKDDPRAWRDEWCNDVTMPLQDLVGEWLQEYRTLKFLGMPGKKSWPGVLRHPEEEGGFMWDETEAMRKIYADHGWPDKYRGEDCREALLQWWEDRRQK
ncbi:hypothetical protein F4803DRAFT_142689 [Xylaria telfairii]|nr:hypothetical protein F4803DRAFT_142689 [Xylaria telfairii]